MARLIDRIRWRLRMLRYAMALKPISGADDGDDGGDGGDTATATAAKPKDGDKPFDQDADKGGDGGDGGDDPDKVASDDDWQTKARKHERAAKKAEKARKEAEQRLREREDEDKSEHEKAVEAAREEGRKQAASEAEKERRADRLEVAVTRAAARGITVGEGKDARTVKFADPEDALLRVERGLRNGDIDDDDIYDSEGKVNTDALSDALGEIAERNKHLVGEGERPKPSGDADARKGETADKDLEAMTPEDHARRKYGDKK